MRRFSFSMPDYLWVCAWVLILIFLGATLSELSSGTVSGVVLGLIPLFIVSLCFVVIATIEVDEEGIKHTTLSGLYGISWQEIERVEVSQDGGSLALSGDNKCLTTLGPKYWKKKEREQALAFIKEQADKAGAEINELKQFKFSRNVKLVAN
jgi:hypothetical protein